MTSDRARLPDSFVCGQTHFGISGSGKTFASFRLADQAVDAGGRALVFDHMREATRPGSGPRRPFAKVATPSDCDRATRAGWRYLVAQAPPFGALSLAPLLRWGLTKGDTVFVVTEAHNYWPTYARPGQGLDPESSELLTGYRHFRCGYIADSQRAAQLSKTCTEQSAVVRVFAIVGKTDLDVVEAIAPGLAAAATQAADYVARGYKGYHARVDMYQRRGPWTLTRL